MTGPLLHRHLDPGETLGEVLFGLIMVLTFTVGARLLTAREELDASELALAAIGCNLAWGLIDAVLFVLGRLYSRSQRARFFRAVKNAASEADALALIRQEFGLEDEPVAIRSEDSARLHRAILELASHTSPLRARLQRRDLAAAAIVFALVSATAVPGVLPFLVLGNSYLALRLSNLLLMALLFLVGYGWARYTDFSPRRVGLTVLLLGLALVLVAVALGG